MAIISKVFGKNNLHHPEDDFVITITSEIIKVEHPKLKSQEVLWTEINEIRLINSDEGPWLIDLWLALLCEKGSCFIPHGTKGFEEVYDIVSKYEGFDYGNVIKSMSCTDNEQFLLWVKNKS